MLRSVRCIALADSVEEALTEEEAEQGTPSYTCMHACTKLIHVIWEHARAIYISYIIIFIHSIRYFNLAAAYIHTQAHVYYTTQHERMCTIHRG